MTQTLRRGYIQEVKEALVKSGVIFPSYTEYTHDEHIHLLSETIADAILEYRRTSITPEEMEEIKRLANKKVDAVLTLNAGRDITADWEGRIIFFGQDLIYADWFNKKTNLACKKRNQADWKKTFRSWWEENLEIQDLEAAYAADITWRGIYTRPSELTAKAVALRAQRLAQPKVEERTSGAGHYA